jgi:galactokinase
MPSGTEPAEDVRERVVRAFVAQHGTGPTYLARAPGRVNLIGEHTDYNEGFVLPMAIPWGVWIAIAPSPDETVLAFSLDFEGPIRFSARRPERGGPKWGEYLKGVAWALGEAGVRVAGWQGAVGGNVPIGAGLSSSAAIEVAAARAFAAVSGVEWDPARMALLAQKAENDWVGVRCGIMDQMVSAAAREGHALLIDCRTLALRHLPLPPSARVVVIDSGVRRGLVDSAYNERREQCEHAARRLGRVALRDVPRAELEARAAELPETTMRRARHVITEIERTLQAADALSGGDVAEFGRLMSASHASLRDDFEVSTRELDRLVELAVADPSCYGARMTGAGFGGCVVALVKAEAAEGLARRVCQDYARSSGRQSAAYLCEAAEGAQLLRM